jgi:putative intracellular protease/amidase
VKTVLFVLSSHDTLGDTGKPTGYLLSEVAIPWKIISDAGIDSAFVSPKGGTAAMVGDKADPDSIQFIAAFGDEGPETMAPAEVDPSAYDAIFFVGGHGPMWDFAGNTELAAIASSIWEADGVVAAVCHGPAGLLDAQLSDGTYLVAGRHVSAMPDELESQREAVPFLLASALTERGAIHEPGERMSGTFVVDGRLITGQDPSACAPMTDALVAALAAGVG